VSYSPNGNLIRTLLKTNNGQVFAGSNRGLFRLEKETWRSVPGFEGKVIYAISGGKNLDTLIATSTGLFDLSGRQMLSGDARDIADFRSRMYAAVFGRGIVQVPNGSGQMQVISSDETSTSVFEGVDRLWIGTAGKGLFCFDGNSVKQEITPDTLKSGTISKMRVAVDGSLWIAGQHGVFRVVNGKPERIFEVDDVRDVYLNGDEFWAATTTRGLIHGRRDDRFGWIISAIGFEQGLPSEKAFSILPTDDGLLIATNRGVVTYKPGTVSPKIIATRFLSQRVHDLSELRSKIELDYPQNSLLLEVAGQSSRTFPEEFQYAFVLKNAKGEEVARQLSNEAQYAPRDLAAGDYTIQVTAFNRDLLPSEPLTISFSVASAPFPWMATALGVLLAIAVIGLVWAAFEHRRIRQRNRELAAARFDLANEAERERSRIARDLHDQTLADLRLLMMRSDKGELSQPELRHEIESVSTEIRRICEDLSPSVLENVGLVPALEFLLSQAVDDHAFSADEGIEDRIQFPLNAQLQIYRIAQEVLANIRRHSNADHVEMSVTAADHEFRLSISDNGTAFQPDSSAGKGRGIANIRSRANLIGGGVAWKESRRGGNTFTV
jgi:signal transduction histidine kinase